MSILGIIIRICVPMAACCALGILAAANWPNPDDPAAGVVIGGVAVLLGFAISLALCAFHEDKRSKATVE